MPLGIALIGLGLVLVYSGYHGYTVSDVIGHALGGAPDPKHTHGTPGPAFPAIPPNHAPGSIDPSPVAPGPLT